MRRDLVERAMAGDRDAFTELGRAQIDRLYAIAPAATTGSMAWTWPEDDVVLAGTAQASDLSWQPVMR